MVFFERFECPKACSVPFDEAVAVSWKVYVFGASGKSSAGVAVHSSSLFQHAVVSRSELLVVRRRGGFLALVGLQYYVDSTLVIYMSLFVLFPSTSCLLFFPLFV